MEVVSLRRIEESHNYSKASGKSVFYLVPKMILLGVILSSIFIIAAIKIENQPKKSADRQKQQPVNVASLKDTFKSHTFTINPEQIAPDSNDMAIVFANKFLDSLSSPSPDCKLVACAALTFDDGPDNKSTPIILNALERNLAHATFFELGNRVTGNQKILLRMEAGNNEIGNHSWSHQSFYKLKKDQIKSQVVDAQKAIGASGVPTPTLFRPPYGDYLMAMQKTINMTVILWNVDPKDWAYKDPAKIAEAVKKQIKPGAIIVMHDREATARAIPIILRDLKDKYHFVTVSQLLNLRPSVKGTYIGR